MDGLEYHSYGDRVFHYDHLLLSNVQLVQYLVVLQLRTRRLVGPLM